MNLTEKAKMKHMLALMALKTMSNPLFERFSWNRVRVALVNIEKCDAYFVKDGGLRIDFLYHQHSVELFLNGKGFIYNPWVDETKRYSVLAPHDVQAMVQELWNHYNAPIPINMDLN